MLRGTGHPLPDFPAAVIAPIAKAIPAAKLASGDEVNDERRESSDDGMGDELMREIVSRGEAIVLILLCLFCE
jgi:hypothetical protein